jgi:hypothetical protein
MVEISSQQRWQHLFTDSGMITYAMANSDKAAKMAKSTPSTGGWSKS